MDLSIVISTAALLLSVATYVVHDRKIKKQEQIINQYQIEKIHTEKIDSQKALIKANLIKEDSGRRIIKVFNAGKGIASNIKFNILTSDKNFFLLNTETFPLEFLNPQESVELNLTIHKDSPEKIKIEFTWDDRHKTDNKYEQIMILY